MDLPNEVSFHEATVVTFLRRDDSVVLELDDALI